jgi:hypothetical protein
MTEKEQRDNICRTWSLFYQEGTAIELRAPKCGRNKTVSGYFTDAAAFVKATMAWNGQAPNLYATLNPVNIVLLSRCANRAKAYAEYTTADEDIIRRRFILIDFDARRPAGISATDSEHEAALECSDRCRAWLKEKHGVNTIHADSGNGGHILLPVDLPNDDASKSLLERFLDALASIFDTEQVAIDTTTFNAGRISKIYGTLTQKGDNTPDRPHRYARLLEVPEELTPVPVSVLSEIAALLPEPEPQNRDGQRFSTAGGFDLQTFMTTHDLRVRRELPYKGGVRYQLENCPFNPDHTAPDAAIFRYADGRLGFRCLHKSCKDKNWRALRSMLDPTYDPDKPFTAHNQNRENSQQSDQSQSPPSGTAGEWEELVPLHEWTLPPFPIEVFPEPICAFVEALAANTQTPPALTGMQTLATCAAAVAKTHVVQAGPNWIEPLNIYALTVLPSGSRKSAVVKAATRPLCEIEQDKNAELAPIIAEAESTFRMLNARLKRAEEEATKGKAQDARLEAESEARALAKEIQAFNHPKELRLRADDVTPEQMNCLLAEQEGRLAIISAEGGLFELVAGRYSQGVPNLDAILKAHIGDDITVDRIGRPPLHIADPALTLGLAVQPDVLSGLRDKPGFRGRGLVARFFYALPECNIGFRSTDAPELPEEVEIAYEETITRLAKLTPIQREDGSKHPRVLHFTDEALALFKDFRAHVESTLGPTGDLHDLMDWGSKLPGGVARIAGIFHLVVHGDTDRNISRATVCHAINLGKYLAAHAKAAYGEMGLDPDVEDARRVLKWIKQTGDKQFSKRDAHYALQGRFKRADDLNRPLEILIERNYLRPIEAASKSGAGRKPSPVFEVSPRLTE